MLADGQSRAPAWIAGMFLLVVAILCVPAGGWLASALADVGGGGAATAVVPDTVSDAVAATAAEFRVDESGAATYSIPIYGVPGTAGVAPAVSLGYSSQGGYGPLGKGWSIAGLSAITRCRATREAGDFISSPTVDGNPRPINFSASDRFCLDGQRLLAVPNDPACSAVSGMSVLQLRTEIESWQRICAYTPVASSQNGPAFFTVERKDGSTSWYGDRDNNASGNRPDGYFETNSSLNPGAALLWAQTRFQDSTGNYIDYLYKENPAGAATREHLIGEVRYTGKIVLAGQAGSAQSPYARLIFNYTARPTGQQSRGYASGGTLDQTQRLASITACANAAAGACATQDQARHYRLTYATSVSGSNQEVLAQLQECRDDGSDAVCMAPTRFEWSAGKFEFATVERPSNFTLANDHIRGFKIGDIDGDGRQDVAFQYLAGTGCVGGTWIVTATSTMSNNVNPAFSGTQFNCVPANIVNRGDGAWHLFDYDGDGRDDLFVSRGVNQGWQVHPSTGTGFNMSVNLISGLSPAIPSVDDKNSQAQLADLNGDALVDVIYPRAGKMYARLMERQGAGFGWGAERLIQIDETSLVPAYYGCDGPPPPSGVLPECTYSIAGMPTPKTSFMQMADFNGDAASDLLIRVTVRIKSWTGYPGCIPVLQRAATGEESGKTARRFVTDYAVPPSITDPGREESAAAAGPVDPCWEITNLDQLHALVATDITSSAITLVNHAELGAGNPEAIVLADINGDGLTDAFIRSTAGSDWLAMINTGLAFTTAGGGSLPLSNYREHARFADVNGDGRTDMLYLVDVGGNKVYYARLALPGGGFAPGAPIPGGNNARLCEGSGCDPASRAPLFADFDGDGNLDFLSLNFATSSTGLYVSRSTSRYAPRDTIVRIINGLSAETELAYGPLTLKNIYRRDGSSRNALDWGRGSPVLDFLAPGYVVYRASSSSPQWGAATAKASLHYRYTTARVQAGGRGSLGFASVQTIDTNQGNGFVVTTTHYAQDFPFVGMPVRTLAKEIQGAAYAVPPCLAGVVDNSCFTTPGTGHDALGGSWFTDSTQSWEAVPAIAQLRTSQVPAQARTKESEEKLRDPFADIQTGRVLTAFAYGSSGNIAATSVKTFNGTDTSPVSTVATANTYGDDTAQWRLGRLTASTVTHSRPGLPDVVRKADFAYSTSGAYTGLLTAERTQSGSGAALDLRKEYVLDSYGNRTTSLSCADPATACTTAISFQPSSSTQVQRYSRTTWDSRGRYPVNTIEPFWNGSTTVEKTASTVVSRNIFGDVTQAYDINGMDSLAVPGTFGRAYYAWAETVPGATVGNPAQGRESFTTYRFCGSGANQVSCPVGAVFMQRVQAAGIAPQQWTYFDALGRTVMQAVKGYNINVDGQDARAICTAYDAAGRVSRVSQPFFLPGISGSAPVGVEGVCSAPAVLWTTTDYDLLGRPVAVETPAATGTAAMVTDYSGSTIGITDARGNRTRNTRNALGELVQVIDPDGTTMNHAYHADGTLKSVTRDVGRGAIVNSFSYDVLGRKVQQVDPDSGTSSFQYNAVGELLVQVDGNGARTENEYDARGRVWRRTTKAPGGAVETQSVFTWDTAANGVGQLASETITGNYSAWSGDGALALGFTRSHGYDLLGRALSTTTTIDGTAYPGQVRYDTLGRPWKSQDASGRWTKTEYNARGLAVSLCDSSETDAAVDCANNAGNWLRILKDDAWGNVVQERRGDSGALQVSRSYHPRTGLPVEICGGSTGCNLVREAYTWDKAGNLGSRAKEGRYAETFYYDSLNRLTTAYVVEVNGVAITAQVSHWAQYDGLGNVCAKTVLGWGTGLGYAGRAGCGVTTEHGTGSSGLTGPHQLTRVDAGAGAATFQYDAAGNQTFRDMAGTVNDRTVRYSAAGQPHEIVLGTVASPVQRDRFWYGSDGQRYKQQELSGKVTLYVGGVEIVKEGGNTTYRRYVGGVLLQTVTGSTVTSRYLFHDQLGSVVRVADASGVAVDSGDYTALGERRSYSDPLVSGTPLASTPRGYTGHEMLDSVGLIHMNARLYDAVVGRFLQADPVIEAPGGTQGWNAYSYLMNNPLNATDPTGMFSLRKALGIAIGIVAAVFQQYYIAQGAFAAAFGVGVAGGFVSGYVMSGTIRGGVTGAFGAGLTFGAGLLSQGWGLGGQVLAQSLSGGIVDLVQGGKFGHGFVAAGLATLAMPLASHRYATVRAVGGALIGGTISELTGGKFANGAMSGAIRGAMMGRPMSRRFANMESMSGGVEPLSDVEARAVMLKGVAIFRKMRADGVMDGMDLYAEMDAVRSKYPRAFVFDYDGVRTFVAGGGEVVASVDIFDYTGITIHRVDSLDDVMRTIFHEVAHLNPRLAAIWRESTPHPFRMSPYVDKVAQVQVHNEIKYSVDKLMGVYREKYKGD